MDDVRDAQMIGRTTDGRTVRRPLSPHLQIYKPQITSGVSIFNRITGVALCAGTLLLVWWLAGAATSDHAYAVVSGVMRSWIGILVLVGWTASLWFHFLGGIRHLMWDAGRGYDLPTVHTTGWGVIGGTAALTVLTWLAVVVI